MNTATSTTARKMSARRADRKPSSAPTCVFCHQSGNGVQFAIFNPRFKPFGTACVACESTLPAGTQVPATT